MLLSLCFPNGLVPSGLGAAAGRPAPGRGCIFRDSPGTGLCSPPPQTLPWRSEQSLLSMLGQGCPGHPTVWGSVHLCGRQEADICPPNSLPNTAVTGETSDRLLQLGSCLSRACVTPGRSLGSVPAHAMRHETLGSAAPESEFIFVNTEPLLALGLGVLEKASVEAPCLGPQSPRPLFSGRCR